MTDEAALPNGVNAATLTGNFSLGGLFSTNNPLMQIFLFGVVGQLLGAALQPVVQSITDAVWPDDPSVPLSPADLAMSVVRQIKSETDAAAEALQSGVNADRFHEMTLLSGDAPAAELLAVALRRGFINEATYERGVAQGRMRTEWAPLFKQMIVEQPSPLEPLQALLEGQLTESVAKELYQQYGGDPAAFQWRFDSRGAAPTPLEAAEAARRGIIAWTGTGPTVLSYEQAFLEGSTRNKWVDVFRALADYIPPPRTLVAMHSAGSLSDAETTKYLKWNGVPDDLIAAFLAEGAGTRTAATKNLALSTIIALYEDHLVTRPQAQQMIEGLRYTTEDAGFILSVADFREHAKFVGLAVSKVHTQYINYKIDKTQAVSALQKLGMDPTDVTTVMVSWDLERDVNAKVLTAAEVATAFKWSLTTADDALQRLQQLGYTAADAWLYLAQHNHGATGLPPAPAGVKLPPPTK